MIDDIILEAVEGRYAQGDSFRIRHTEEVNGSVCTTKDKPPAMTVTRTAYGWVYHCHRCHTSGCATDSNTSPTNTKERLKAIKNSKIDKTVAEVTLPNDFQPMSRRENDSTIPWAAYHWIWQYGISSEDFTKFNVGWSQLYQRVIIPLYEYAHWGDEDVTLARDLVGWVGRDVNSKDIQRETNTPKWLTRSKKGKRRYFATPGDDTVVLVEDAISAIVVHLATGHTTIGLLTTSVSEDLMRVLRGKTIYLWLDGDMLAHSVATVDRMRQLGLKAKHIHTPKDPKEYNKTFIQDTLKVK